MTQSPLPSRNPSKMTALSLAGLCLVVMLMGIDRAVDGITMDQPLRSILTILMIGFGTVGLVLNIWYALRDGH